MLAGVASRNAAVLEWVVDAIFIVDEVNTITEFNHAAEQMFGRTRADVIGRRIDGLLQPVPHPDAFSHGGAPVPPIEPGSRVEMTAQHADGRRFPVELALTRLPVAGKAQFAGLVRDISERRSHEAVTDACERLAAIVEATTDLVSIRMLDFSGVAYMNQAGRTMLGLGPQERVPDLAAFRSEESLAEWTDLILPSALREGSWEGETTYVDRSGCVIPVLQQLLAHAARDGKIQLSTIARDITDRRRSAAELRASDDRLRFALEAAGMGVWEIDVRTRAVTWTEMQPPDRGSAPGHFAGTEDAFLAALHVDDREATRLAVEPRSSGDRISPSCFEP